MKVSSWTTEPVRLERIEPDRNVARFYELELAPTLFGEWALTRRWGRIGARGRTKQEWLSSIEAATHAGERLLQRRIRRAYRPLA